MLDLKIGTRHYSDDAPPKKIAKEQRKAATTTIGTHGLRIVGCRIPAADPAEPRWAEVWGYKLGNDADASELPAVLLRFLGTAERVATARGFAEELRAVFATQQEYVFYGSSLLLAYDAALGDDAPLRIKMIDFGHVHGFAQADSTEGEAAAALAEQYYRGGLGNDGYMHGLVTLLEILQPYVWRGSGVWR